MRGRLSSAAGDDHHGLTGLSWSIMLAHYAGGSTAILWAGQPAWRWMFWLQALPGRDLFPRVAGHSGKPALSGGRGDEAGAQAC
jgi:SP family sugar:H+ symporter-like MFS transporter